MHNLPCPPALWPRFSALLDAALDIPELGRAAWLASLPLADAVLRTALEQVLLGGTGENTSHALTLSSRLPEQESFAPGAYVGPYRLEARIGEGGMGEVWRACRDDDGPRREVALKLPHAELLGGPFRLRFARERDTLAGLSHPHIAQLYDAGSSAGGHPYLALELVAGKPITEWCRTERSPLDRRIDLVLQVLDGLSYAHRRLIVHRDIKPSNVLVTPEGTAKILDFGIAKLLHPDSAENVTLTQPKARLATPAYAAPEQLDGGAITVATDLFSVGVLLFELCTGHRPFARVPLEADAAAAPMASHRLDQAASGLPDTRRTAARMRGDLDAVIAKAVALEPAGRYPSAEAFSGDLRRWRAGLPVQARRTSWTIRAQKFIRRNKLGVGLASVLAIALAGGTAGIAWQARRAEAQAARATAIQDYLVKLFAQGDPRSGRSIVNMTAKELLDLGADRAGAAFARDPETEMQLMRTLDDIYDAVGDSTRAEASASRRVDLARRMYGPVDPRTIDASLDLVATEALFQDEDKARKLTSDIRAQVLAVYGADSLQWAGWLLARAASLRDAHGGRDEAVADDQAAIAIYERRFGNDPQYPDALEDLAGYQYDAEQCAQAMASFQKARAIHIARHEFDSFMELQNRAGVANDLTCLGNVKEADRQLAWVEAQAERQLGRHSIWYLYAVTSRAQTDDLTGNRQTASGRFQSLLSSGMDAASATGFPTSARRAYGATLARDGQLAEAIPILKTVLMETRRHLKDEPNLRRTEMILGDAYDQAGRTEEARELLKAGRDEYVAYSAPGMPHVLQAEERWARFCLDHGDTASALREFNAVLDQSHGVPSDAAAMAEAGLARIALAAGDVALADRHSARAMAVIDATTILYDVRRRVDIWLVRAQSLAASGHTADARALAERAVAAAEIYDAPSSPQLSRARGYLQTLSGDETATTK
jgi:tetratricopeptide (TPR) repeat protein